MNWSRQTDTTSNRDDLEGGRTLTTPVSGRRSNLFIGLRIPRHPDSDSPGRKGKRRGSAIQPSSCFGDPSLHVTVPVFHGCIASLGEEVTGLLGVAGEEPFGEHPPP